MFNNRLIAHMLHTCPPPIHKSYQCLQWNLHSQPFKKILKYNVIDGKENPTVDTSIFEIYIIQEHTKVF